MQSTGEEGRAESKLITHGLGPMNQPLGSHLRSGQWGRTREMQEGWRRGDGDWAPSGFARSQVWARDGSESHLRGSWCGWVMQGKGLRTQGTPSEKQSLG